MSSTVAGATSTTIVEAESFERWSGESSETIAKLAKKNASKEVTAPVGTLSLEQNARFPVDVDLNRKLVLW